MQASTSCWKQCEQALEQALLVRWWNERPHFSEIQLGDFVISCSRPKSLEEMWTYAEYLTRRVNCICSSCLGYVSRTVRMKRRRSPFTVAFKMGHFAWAWSCMWNDKFWTQFNPATFGRCWAQNEQQITFLVAVRLTFMYMAASWNHHQLRGML